MQPRLHHISSRQWCIFKWASATSVNASWVDISAQMWEGSTQGHTHQKWRACQCLPMLRPRGMTLKCWTTWVSYSHLVSAFDRETGSFTWHLSRCVPTAAPKQKFCNSNDKELSSDTMNPSSLTRVLGIDVDWKLLPSVRAWRCHALERVLNSH